MNASPSTHLPRGRESSDFQVELPATAENVGFARHVLGALGSNAGVGEDSLDSIRLAVSEALSNVVAHAYSDEPDGQMAVNVWVEDPGVIVSVSDEGRGIDAADDSPGLGLGLPLITELAEAVELETSHDSGGTVVWMYFAETG